MYVYHNKKQQLLYYIHLYLSKNLRMNIVLEGIKNKLYSDQLISQKQFKSIIKFLEREPFFRNWNRKQIFTHFKSLIEINNNTTTIRKQYEPNDLTPFFT
jgi:hypothetical protein